MKSKERDKGVMGQVWREGEPILVTMRSEARVCGHSLAGIAGSNPVGDMDGRLL